MHLFVKRIQEERNRQLPKVEGIGQPGLSKNSHIPPQPSNPSLASQQPLTETRPQVQNRSRTPRRLVMLPMHLLGSLDCIELLFYTVDLLSSDSDVAAGE